MFFLMCHFFLDDWVELSACSMFDSSFTIK